MAKSTNLDKNRKQRFDKLANLCKKLNTGKFGGSNKDALCFFGSGDKSYNIERFSSGAKTLDAALGGGWPRGRICEIYGPESGGKCHARGTEILMYDGTIKKVEDIIEGDLLMGSDSTPRTVLSLCRGREKMYRISPRKGLDDSFIVNESHMLSLKNTEIGNKFGEITNITVKEYITKSNNYRYYNKLYRVPIYWTEKDLSVEPYFLGLWLGDGSSDNVGIHTADNEVVEYINDYADRLDMSVSVTSCGKSAERYSIIAGKGKYQNEFCLQNELRNIGVLDNKHIPHCYKTSSIEDRLDLLAGLLDSDGYKGASKMVFCSCNKKLAEDVLFVARSVGFFCNMKEYIAKLDRGDFGIYECPAYKVYINGDCERIPLKIKRKIPDKRSSYRDWLVSSFDVEPLEEDDYFGFELDCDHLYLLNNFIVQHNSTLCLHAIAEFQKRYVDEDVGIIDSEHCLAKGSLVFDAENMVYVPVEDIVGTEIFIVSVRKNGDIFKQKAIVKSNGCKSVYRVECEHGFSLVVTDNHKVKTNRGYLEIKDLQIGDSLYSPNKLDIDEYDVDDVNIDLYRILGYHIGDGTKGKAEISNIDEDVIDDLENISKKYGCKITSNGITRRIVKSDLKFYDITEEYLRNKIESGLTILEISSEVGCCYETVRRRIKEYGLEYNFRSLAAIQNNRRKINCEKKSSFDYFGGENSEIYRFLSNFSSFNKNSKERSIPKGLALTELSEVLTGMYMTDGFVVDPEKSNRCSVGYSTSSYRLANDLQASLLRFGIFSWKSKSIKRKDNDLFYDPTYTVWITGYTNVKLFSESIKLLGYKYERMMLSLNSVKETSSRLNVDSSLIAHNVKSIEYVGEEETFDISAKNEDFEEQNFLCDGVFVHNSLDIDYARNLGVDVDLLLINQPESGEQALNIAEQMLDSGVKMIIVDSVAALTPQAELNGDIGDNHVANQARLMSQGLRRLVSKVNNNNAFMLFTNQVRDLIGVTWGAKTTTPGGKALKFYASCRVEIRRVGSDKDGDEIVCNRVIANVAKNKVSPPFRKAEFIISFGYGIDQVAAILDDAISKKVVKKSGAWFYFNGETVSQGRAALLDKMRNDQEFLKNIEDAANKALDKNNSDKDVVNESNDDSSNDDELYEEEDANEIEIEVV